MTRPPPLLGGHRRCRIGGGIPPMLERRRRRAIENALPTFLEALSDSVGAGHVVCKKP